MGAHGLGRAIDAIEPLAIVGDGAAAHDALHHIVTRASRDSRKRQRKQRQDSKSDISHPAPFVPFQRTRRTL
jgi:hypothetical protein